MSVSSVEGILKALAISLSQELSFIAVGTDDMPMQLMLLVFIVDHLTDVPINVLMHATRSWGSSPSLAVTSSSFSRCTCVLTSCVIPCCIFLRKVEAFTLVALPVPLHLQ